jgi:hypothetical protein
MLKIATADMDLIPAGMTKELKEDKSFQPRKMSRGGRVLMLCCVPLVLLAVYYAPAMSAIGSRLLHGSTVDYRGLRVEVPWGWSADLNSIKDDYPANPQGITVQKPPRTLNLESRGPELIYINLLLPDAHSTPQQQAGEWKNLFLQSHPETVFNIAERNSLLPEADCVEATPRLGTTRDERGAALACVSISQGWLANYAGLQANVPVFLKVLSNLKQ